MIPQLGQRFQYVCGVAYRAQRISAEMRLEGMRWWIDRRQQLLQDIDASREKANAKEGDG